MSMGCMSGVHDKLQGVATASRLAAQPTSNPPLMRVVRLAEDGIIGAKLKAYPASGRIESVSYGVRTDT